MTVRIDISAHDDTELGAEVRAAYRDGRRMVVLVDSMEPDTRAGVWVDGTHGLYKMRCENEHIWLTALGGQGDGQPLQGECTICGRDGEWVED